MNQEQRESLAKAATDSFFANLSETQKKSLTASSDTYIKAYIEIYEQAVNTITKKYEPRLPELQDIANKIK